LTPLISLRLSRKNTKKVAVAKTRNLSFISSSLPPTSTRELKFQEELIKVNRDDRLTPIVIP